MSYMTGSGTTNSLEEALVEIRDGEGALTTVPLVGERAVIGRSAGVDIRLDHGMVSRQHAEIARDPMGQVVIRDLGSRNGTLVNGTPVRERVLLSGDQVSVGPFTLRVKLPNETATHFTTRLVVSDLAAGRISTLEDIETPRVSAAHLTTLTELSKHLLSIEDPDARREALCRLLVGERFHGRWAAVVRMVAGDDAPQLVAEARQAGFADQPHLSRSVLRAVGRKREAVLAGNAQGPADVQVSIAVDVVPMATVACPLSDEDDGVQMDLLYAVLPPEYGTGEWLALTVMAAKQYEQAESAWRARKSAEDHAVVERELERARQIQMRLVPSDPQISGLDVAVGFSPCRWVGGDYVDVVPTGDGRVLLAVADVCGKGLPAALVAASLHTMVHASVLGGMGLCDFMNNLNRYLIQTQASETFVTMVVMLVDPRSGAIEFANAGHPPPVVLGPGGAPRAVKGETQFPLGIEEQSITCHSAQLEPGELLVLFTDGLTELRTEGKLLGVDGLCARLKEVYAREGMESREVAAGLTEALNALQGAGAPEDDRTFLLARRE
jgi:serine phosphatase RsbU (regulator of sigma subunit)